MEHDWVLATAIPITQREVEKCLRGEPIVFHEVSDQNTRGVSIVCYRCELPPEDAVAECPGEPTSYDEVGTPLTWSERPRA